MPAIELLTQGDLYPVLDEIKKINLRLESMIGLNGALVYTNDSLAKLLGVSKRTLQSYRDKRKIYYSKVDRLIFYRKEDVETFLTVHSNALFPNEQVSKSYNQVKRKSHGR